MTPTIIGDCTLYCGDARDVLPQIASESVDAVVADIPYGVVNRDSGGLRNLDKGVADVESFPLEFAAKEAARLASGSVYLWCGTEQVSQLRSALIAEGMTTRLCIWEKSNPSPVNGQRLWLSGLECCIFGRHPKAYFARHCKSPIWRGPIVHNQVHETQKPVWLMEELVDASAPVGGTVLDFCMGSGTTGVACVKLGRKFIGVERERRHFETACDRIRKAYAETPLLQVSA